MTQPGAREPMTPDDAARAKEIDAIVTMIDSVGSTYLDWKGQLFQIAAKVYEYAEQRAAQAAQRETEECALIAVGYCWEATDMKPPKARWKHQVAKEIATALRARCHPTPDRKE